jgi:chemotaxis signal transduction protein
MTGEGTSLDDRAAALRREFDDAFAAPLDLDRPATEDLLAIRVAGDPLAFRLAEIALLVADRRITRLPVADPACLGLAGLRGTVVTVYDLAVLAGYRPSPSPRWLVVTAGAARIALAVEQVEGHVRVPRQIRDGAEVAELRRPLVGGVVRVNGTARRLLHVPSIVEDVRRRAGAS